MSSLAADLPFALPPELLIDTGVARRLIGEFIRGHLRQAGFERVVLGLSGGIDSALVGLPGGRGDRRRAPAVPAAALPDSSPEFVVGRC